MKNLRWYSLILLICCACEREIDLVPPYPGDQPVMNALLTPDSALTLWLTYTIPSLTPSEPDSIPRITDATVWALADDDTLTTLAHVGEGVYRAVDSLRPLAGQSYRLVARLATGEVITHEPVRMPPAIPAQVLSYEQDAVTLPFNGGEERDRLRVVFDDPSGLGDAYELRLQPLPGPDARINYQREQSQADELDACPVYAQVFTDSCSDGQRQELTFLVANTYRLDFDEIAHDSLRLILYTWSDSYYRRVRSQAQLAGTLEEIFFSAETPYTNVIGGLGLVAARNRSALTFPTGP